MLLKKIIQWWLTYQSQSHDSLNWLLDSRTDYILDEKSVNQQTNKMITISFSFTGWFWRSWIIEQACRNRQDQLQWACWWDQETLGRIISWKQIIRQNCQDRESQGKRNGHKNVNDLKIHWCNIVTNHITLNKYKIGHWTVILL